MVYMKKEKKKKNKPLTILAYFPYTGEVSHTHLELEDPFSVCSLI